ncbi:MAG: FAD-dependent oxidoreductase, partial [Candidatus Omnitrophica bacterium]|nr:FAD-dependent oxidoreductase [Candidatus Omnitrophota bacterium]
YNIRGSVPIGKKVIVVGGGNAAIDAARTALRLGAESVTVLYRRSQEEMPAYAEEVREALYEGVVLIQLTHPMEILKTPENKVSGVKCMTMKLGDYDRSGRRRPTADGADQFVLDADQVIVAIGQTLGPGDLFNLTGAELKKTSHGFIEANSVTGQTSVPGIFAGGDAATGPWSVVAAIGAGEVAAVGIDQFLTGENHAFWREEKIVDTDFDPDVDPVPYPREPVRSISVEKRKYNFDEVELSWNENVAQRQAKRCLRCDYGKSVTRRGCA